MGGAPFTFLAGSACYDGNTMAAENPTPSAALPLAFVAGATGFTGRAMARQDRNDLGVELRLQVRPGRSGRSNSSRHSLGHDDRICEVPLEAEALQAAMKGCDAVVQLIGTVRARFDKDNSYESVDYGTTITLLDAAARAGVSHFVLLSSVGAGMGFGSYLAIKKKTEAAVKDWAAHGEGRGYTILRPSVLAGDEAMEGRPQLTLTSAFLGGMSDTPFGYPFAAIRPINIQVLARIICEVVRRGPQNRVLLGQGLFRVARELGLAPASTLDHLS